MPEPRDSEALAALMTLATRLRDTASAVAARADAAASGTVGRQQPTDEGPEDPWDSADFGAMTDFFRLLGDTVPQELRARLEGSTREALMALRALIDWYLERPDRAVDGESFEDSDPAS